MSRVVCATVCVLNGRPRTCSGSGRRLQLEGFRGAAAACEQLRRLAVAGCGWLVCCVIQRSATHAGLLHGIGDGKH